jgi:hypothetical protein
VPAGNAVAQQARVSYEVSAKDTTYTVQQNINVDDRPNHIVRVYEYRRVFPNNAPVIDDIAVVEEWSRGIADRTDGNGTTKLYNTLVMKNGDKIFAEAVAVVAQNISDRADAIFAGSITGGRGKFTTIKGFVRGTNTFDLKGFNEGKTDIVYSTAK